LKAQDELIKQFSQEKDASEDKIRSLYEMIDQKEIQVRDVQALLKERDAKIETMTQESEDLAKDYFDILDKNVALGERVKELEDYIEKGSPHEQE